MAIFKGVGQKRHLDKSTIDMILQETQEEEKPASAPGLEASKSKDKKQN